MEPSSYSGAGGKIRRPPSSRASASATPYDRPPAAAAAHRLAAAAAAVGSSSDAGYQGPAGGEGAGEGGGWVSRLVDPASRLIAGGAARLFSTVFRKRLAPTTAPASQDPPAARPKCRSGTGSNQLVPLSVETSMPKEQANVSVKVAAKKKKKQPDTKMRTVQFDSPSMGTRSKKKYPFQPCNEHT